MGTVGGTAWVCGTSSDSRAVCVIVLGRLPEASKLQMPEFRLESVAGRVSIRLAVCRVRVRVSEPG